MLAVRLTPRGGRDAIDGIEQLSDGRRVLKVRVRAAASEGEANAALTKLVARTLGVPSRDVSLVAGASARLKRIRVAGAAATYAVMLEKICGIGYRFIRSRPEEPPTCAFGGWARLIMLADSAMTAKIIDGKGIAANLRGKVADAVHRLGRDRGVTPGLAVVLVGNNPASESYVGNKMKMTTGSGMRSFDHRLPATTSEAELLTLIGRLNADPTVHGILVQLPLPAQIDPQ